MNKLLVDESLYTDAARKEEMTRLLLEQASLKSSLEALEWEWLEASEKLEKAEQRIVETGKLANIRNSGQRTGKTSSDMLTDRTLVLCGQRVRA